METKLEPKEEGTTSSQLELKLGSVMKYLPASILLVNFIPLVFTPSRTVWPKKIRSSTSWLHLVLGWYNVPHEESGVRMDREVDDQRRAR